MSDLAPLLQKFFTDRLMLQRQASPHTVASYRDTFRLLLAFTAARTRRQPAQLGLADLDAPLITAFLEHLQADRGNTTATRNARLAAICSFFRYAALHAPEHAATIQRVLAIPPKRRDRAIVAYLTETEIDALLTVPDRATWLGRRDHTLLLVAIHTSTDFPRSASPMPLRPANGFPVLPGRSLLRRLLRALRHRQPNWDGDPTFVSDTREARLQAPHSSP